MSNTKLTGRTTVVIPVSEAIRRTSNWREFMGINASAKSQTKVPKAVYISKQDILDMAARLQDPAIVGARAYFTLNSTAAEEVKNDLTFCMVMVRSCDDYRCGEDVIYLSGDANGVGDGDDDSGIYDFTKPCPDYCDPTSVLFTGDQP